MKKSMLSIMMVTALLMTTFAYAAGPGYGPYGRGYGGCWTDNYQAMENLPQEKQERLRVLFDTHHQETTALRATMWEKQTLLDTLAANPNTPEQTLTTLIKEMGQLRTQMEEKQEALRAQIIKETGINIPMDCGHYGYGPGHMRHGRGGYGPHMGGHRGYGHHMGMGGYYGPGYGEDDYGPRGGFHRGPRGGMRY